MSAREPDIESALIHLSIAVVEADFGMSATSWERGEMPNRAWWAYRNAAEAILRAERELERASRITARAVNSQEHPA